MSNFKGLFVYSITNMLERFGFYCMMSVLVLFLMEQKGFDALEAGNIYFAFYISIHVSMLVMGLVGDFINRRKLIFVGLIFMAIGYFLYSFLSSTNEITLILPGIFIVLGLGAFKPNLQIQVGDLYNNNLKHGAIGYVIFYTFINIGAIFATFAATYLKFQYGYESVFLISGSAIVLSFVLYYLVPVNEKVIMDTFESQLIKTDTHDISDSDKTTDKTKYGVEKIIGLISLIFIVPFFHVAFHQSGLVYNVYVCEFLGTDAYSLDIITRVNPIAFVSFVILAIFPLFYLIKLKKAHSILPIIGIGMIIVAIGYFIPFFYSANEIQLNIIYASLPLIIMALGELFTSPFLILGFYHYSPVKVRGLFMGLYLAIGAAANMLLYKYAVDYRNYGAEYTFMKIVIHILICVIAVFLVWMLIKKLSNLRKR